MEVATYAVVAGAVGTIGLAAGSHAAKGCQGQEPDKKTRRIVPDSGYDETRIAELRIVLEEMEKGLGNNVELYEHLEKQMKELVEEEVQEGKEMTWREEDVQKTEEFDKAEPSEKLQMVESDLGKIKQQATQQEKRIEEFQKRRREPVDESLKVLEKMEKELLDLKEKSNESIKAMETTAHEIERLMVMTPKELDGWQEDDGDKPVTKKEALESMDTIAEELEKLLQWQKDARTTTQVLHEHLEEFKIPKHQPGQDEDAALDSDYRSAPAINGIEQELERQKQAKAAIEQELERQKQAKAAIEQEMQSHKQNAADQRRLVEDRQLQIGQLERKLQELVPATSPETQDALRRAASAEDELALLKREFYVVQERALSAETSAAQGHQEVLMLQARLSSQPPPDDIGMKQLREENEQLKIDNTQLHTNQDTYERNQHVLQEDNSQLLANQQQMEAQLQAALAREEDLTKGTSASTEVSSLKEQLMAAMTQLESQQQAHSVALQKQNQETVAQLEQLGQQLQDAERRIAKLAQEKDSIRQQLYDDHVAKSSQLIEEFEKEYLSLKAQNMKVRREKEAAENKIGKLELELARTNSSVASGRDAITQERDTLSRQLAAVQGDLQGKLTASEARVQQAEARAKQAEAEAHLKEAVAAALQDEKDKATKLTQDLSFCTLQRDGFKAHWEEAKREIDRLKGASPPSSSPVSPSVEDQRVSSPLSASSRPRGPVGTTSIPTEPTMPSDAASGPTSRFGALKARMPGSTATATGAARFGGGLSSTRPGTSLGNSYGTRLSGGTGTSTSGAGSRLKYP